MLLPGTWLTRNATQPRAAAKKKTTETEGRKTRDSPQTQNIVRVQRERKTYCKRMQKCRLTIFTDETLPALRKIQPAVVFWRAKISFILMLKAKKSKFKSPKWRQELKMRLKIQHEKLFSISREPTHLVPHCTQDRKALSQQASSIQVKSKNTLKTKEWVSERVMSERMREETVSPWRQPPSSRVIYF